MPISGNCWRDWVCGKKDEASGGVFRRVAAAGRNRQGAGKQAGGPSCGRTYGKSGFRHSGGCDRPSEGRLPEIFPDGAHGHPQ